MDLLTQASVILGSSWASGVNLYLTAAGLGIAHRLNWIELPGSMDALANPIIITLAILLYLIEFLADKIPYVDSAWDSFHTFIRPAGGAAIAFMGTAGADPVIQTAASLVGGTLALDSHLAKASTRVVINASPEPVTNSVASVSEDAVVAGSLWLIIAHPIVLGVLVLVFVVFSIWFIPKMFRLLGRAFGFLFGKRGDKSKEPPGD